MRSRQCAQADTINMYFVRLGSRSDRHTNFSARHHFKIYCTDSQTSTKTRLCALSLSMIYVPLWLYLFCSGTQATPQCRSLLLSFPLSLSLIVQIAVGHIRLRARGRRERTRRLQLVNAQRAVRVGVKQLVENLDLCVRETYARRNILFVNEKCE
jgi:hypothetical protein